MLSCRIGLESGISGIFQHLLGCEEAFLVRLSNTDTGSLDRTSPSSWNGVSSRLGVRVRYPAILELGFSFLATLIWI